MESAAIVAGYYEQVWNGWDVSALADFVRKDVEAHVSGQPDFGFDELAGFVRAFHTGFPDWRIVTEESVAEGDRVVVRFRSSGTFTGEFLGVPPHGRRVSISGLVLYRLREGRIAAIHMEWDHRAFAEALRPEKGA